MDLLTILNALWRHKFIMILSLAVGLWSAFNIVYESIYDPVKQATELRYRSYTTYETKVRLILDTPDFGLGRLGLQGPGALALARTQALAKTYTYLIQSAPVMNRLKKDFSAFPGSLTVATIEQSPIIEVTAQGKSAYRVRAFADGVAKNFITYIKEQQIRNKVPPEDRVAVAKLGPASASMPLQSRKTEYVLIAALTPFMVGAAISLALENLRRSNTRGKLAADEDVGCPPAEIDARKPPKTRARS